MMRQLVLSLSVLLVLLAMADTAVGQGSHVLWTHGNERGGVPLPQGRVTYSSPVVADVDGIPENGLETVVGGADGYLYALRGDGSLLWQAELPNAGCSSTGATNKLLSSPAVGDLFGKGIPHVVIGYGGLGAAACGGGVVAFRGPDGSRAWHLNLKRFSKRQRFFANMHGVFSSPALADVNGDGKLEIGFGSFDRNVYFLNARGRVVWYYQAADTVWSSPAFANVDNRRHLEMIIGTDITGNERLVPPTSDGGYVYAFRTMGKRLLSLDADRAGKRRKKRKKKKNRGRRKPVEFGFRNQRAYVWQTWFDQTIFSTPVIADVLPEQAGAEVVIGSGCHFPERSDDKRGRWVKVLSLRTGKVLQTLDAPTCLESTPAVGDIDEDGQLEIVATTNGHASMGGDGFSRIVAWNPDNPAPFWEVIPRHAGNHDAFGAHFQSPVIADIDHNGSLEVLVANANGVGIYTGKTGVPLHCHETPCGADTLRLHTRGSLLNTPAVADINLDGQLDVVIGGASANGAGAVHAWSSFASLLGSAPGVHPIGATPWPMFRGNPAHTGVLGN